MARPRLVSAKMLPNHGAVIVHVSTRYGRTQRFVRPNGTVSSFEAAKLLGTYPIMVRRMFKAGAIKAKADARGVLSVPLSECRRLLDIPRSRRIGVKGSK